MKSSIYEYDEVMAMDANIKQCYKNLNPQYIHSSCVISMDLLDKYGYFGQFHQYLNCICSSGGRLKSEGGGRYTSDFGSSESALLPAACLNLYPRIFACHSGGEEVYTTLTKVYRNEEKSYDGRTRLWEFTVRELVFIGGERWVRDQLMQISHASMDYAFSLGIRCELREATDSFAPTKYSRILSELQGYKRSKVELVSPEEVALSSFNYHGGHFLSALGYDRDGIVTGCVGYGIERWLSSC